MGTVLVMAVGWMMLQELQHLGRLLRSLVHRQVNQRHQANISSSRNSRSRSRGCRTMLSSKALMLPQQTQ
jgi:hypothetical protein